MKVSVVIPVFNSADFIERCLEAILNQTFQSDEYEVIVVDDGSVDSSAEKINRFPVRYFYQKNRGPAAARNLGVKEAAGEIILFTDSDCIVSHNWIETMLQSFNQEGVIGVKGAYSGGSETLTARFTQIEFEERYELLKRAERTDMLDTYAAAIKRDIFLELGGFDESFPEASNEDTELSYKLSSLNYKLIFNPHALVHHLGHPETILKYFRQKFQRGYWRTAVYRRFPGKVFKETYTPKSLKVQGLTIFGGLFFLLLSPLYPFTANISVFLFLIFLLTTLPFCVFAMKRDFTTAVFSPFFLTLRALAIGSGVMTFLMKQVLKNKTEGKSENSPL